MTQRRKEHPKTTWQEIEAAVNERINQLRAQLIEDLAHLWQTTGSARATQPLHPNEGRRSGQADPNVWYLPPVWGGLFSPR
jgi:hypothetical protein